MTRRRSFDPLRGDAKIRLFVLPSISMLLVLMVVSVARHRTSLEQPGRYLFGLNLTLLVAYSLAGMLLSLRKDAAWNRALLFGRKCGLFLATVLVDNHVIELLVPRRPFPIIIAPIFLMIAAFGAAGSATWHGSRSIVMAVIASLWCALVATPAFLCVAFCLNLVLQRRAEAALHQLIAASGMADPAGYLIRNMLQAASEFLCRLPAFAVCFSLTGAAIAWLASRSVVAKTTVALIAPLLAGCGALVLWYANTLARDSRPPFVLAGLLLAALALCSAETTWSAWRSPYRS